MNDSFRAKPIGEQSLSPIGFAASQNQPLTDFKVTAAPEKFVVFFLGEQLFGIPAAAIAEVSPPMSVAFLPHTPEWLLGIANLRGEMITILDSTNIFGGKSQTSRDKTKFVILKTKKFDMPIAFPIDRLSEITTLNGQFVPADQNSPLIFSRTSYQNQEIRLVDTEQMLRLVAFK